MTVRVFSMREGLAASTVTPGSTAPEASLTTPAIPLAAACWAPAARGRISAHITTPKPTTVRTMGQPPLAPVCGNVNDERAAEHLRGWYCALLEGLIYTKITRPQGAVAHDRSHGGP